MVKNLGYHVWLSHAHLRSRVGALRWRIQLRIALQGIPLQGRGAIADPQSHFWRGAFSEIRRCARLVGHNCVFSSAVKSVRFGLKTPIKHALLSLLPKKKNKNFFTDAVSSGGAIPCCQPTPLSSRSTVSTDANTCPPTCQSYFGGSLEIPSLWFASSATVWAAPGSLPTPSASPLLVRHSAFQNNMDHCNFTKNEFEHQIL